MGGGRNKDNIWNQFDEKRMPGKVGSRAVCRKCGKEMQGIVLRLKKHYRACVENLSSDSEMSTSTDDSLSDDIPQAKRPKHMKDYLCITSKAYQQKLDNSIGEIIAGCNLPFRLVEHPLFTKLCNELRPGYVPPNRRRLSNEIVPQLYDFHKNESRIALKGVPVCLAVDGWQNIRQEPIICTTVTRDTGESYLATTVDTTGMPHTAENLEILGMYLAKNL